MNQKNIEKIISDLVTAIGEDTQKEGLKDTPRRVAAAYAKAFEGYDRSLKKEITVFKNTYDYDDVIYSGKIDFFSTCEHHLLPFFGIAHIAYIPNKEIIGLSKLARAVDIYSRRLQDQERITIQVADELENLLLPRGVAVLLEGKHLCNVVRGVQQTNSIMKTMAFRGEFKNDQSLRERFLALSDKKDE